MESVEESGLYQNVSFKTFQLRDGHFSNTLDLVFTESKNRIDQIESDTPLGFSLEKAHVVLTWNYNLKYQQMEALKYKKLKLLNKKGNYKGLSKLIDDADWKKSLM